MQLTPTMHVHITDAILLISSDMEQRVRMELYTCPLSTVSSFTDPLSYKLQLPEGFLTAGEETLVPSQVKSTVLSNAHEAQ